MATAVALHQSGFAPLVIERSNESSQAKTVLGLWTNAWKALDALGAGDTLREQHVVVNNVEIARDTGRLLRSFSLSECHGGPHEFRGVVRSHLIEALKKKLPEDAVMYGKRVVDVRSRSKSDHGGSMEVELSDGSVVPCAGVIGADGSRSAVASALGVKPANYSGQVAIRGVARFPDGLPRAVLQSRRSGDDATGLCIRQIWSCGPRFGMYPVSTTELYWFVCFDDDGGDTDHASRMGDDSNSSESVRQEALGMVGGWKWDVEEIIAATPLTALKRNRIVDRWDVPPLLSIFSGERRKSGGNPIVATLVGDALHPMTPNLGQGGCTALEDAVVLAALLKKRHVLKRMDGCSQMERNDMILSVFDEYERERVKRTLPLTVRSYMMGYLLQLPLLPVALARDLFVSNAFDTSHFLDHATYDCTRVSID